MEKENYNEHLKQNVIGVKELTDEDFKITEDGEEMNVTKAEYNPFSGGYFLEWEKKENY